MKNIAAIFRREVLSFFVSPVAYFVITGFVLLSGYFFFNLLGYYNLVLQRYSMMPYATGGNVPNLNEWVVEGFFQTMILILVFLVPLITMRTIAEEKRSGTFELLITSPLSVLEIVLGKFLSVGFVLLVMFGLMFCFPLLLCVYGDPEVKPILSGFFGVVLAGLAFASIGMAVSSFTENQIVAAISSLVVLLLLYVIHSPAESIGGTTGAILEYLSPSMQVRDMLKGVISLKSLVYFSTIIVTGLVLSQRALDAHRWR